MKTNIWKKYVSVWELFAGSTIYKIAVLLAVMGAVQIFLFQKAMMAYIPMDTYDLDFLAIEHYSLEYMTDKSHSAVVLAVAFVLLTVVLCRNGCNIGSKSSYTLKRLQVTEKMIFLMQCIYNSLCYVLLLGVQVAVLLIQSGMYTAHAKYVTNQTVFLAFYRNDFMHSVLPLDGGMRWLVNLLFIIGCGVAAAVFTYRQRYGKVAWVLWIVPAEILISFIRGMEDTYISLLFAIAVCMTAGISAFRHVFGKSMEE